MAGNQARPAIFDLEIKKPELLYESVVEVDERVQLAPKTNGNEEGEQEKVEEQERYPSEKGVTGEFVEIIKEPDLEKLRADLQVCASFIVFDYFM